MKTVIIDTRVSPRMKALLLANRQGKLHPDQLREIVYEPFVRLLLLLVPVIILLRGFLITLFVGGWWMVGAVGIGYGMVQLFRRRRRYSRLKMYYGIFHLTPPLPPKWQWWKPLRLEADSGKVIAFQRSLASEKHFQADQRYIVYYVKDLNHCVLLSFAPTDHPNIDDWTP